jgi:VIT1/CCC1 family predicted Fe2+/Mn2+ transporter
LIPLIPYMLTVKSSDALMESIVATVAALAIFGFVKGRFTGVAPVKSALRTALIGGVAAAVAFGIAKVFAG